jgi:hypothetical protein
VKKVWDDPTRHERLKKAVAETIKALPKASTSEGRREIAFKAGQALKIWLMEFSPFIKR